MHTDREVCIHEIKGIFSFVLEASFLLHASTLELSKGCTITSEEKKKILLL